MSQPWRMLSSLLAACCLATAIPAIAWAVAPNQLANPRVSPASGSTATSFTFAVDYASDKGFAATSVVALVAGRSVALGLASGTPTGGTYAGASTLPAGTWSVTFEAHASQGPSPSVAGPTVTVSAPVPVAPSPSPTPPPPPTAPPPTTRPPTTAPPAAPGAEAPASAQTPAGQPVATANSAAGPSVTPASASPREGTSPADPSGGTGPPSGSPGSGPAGAGATATPLSTNGPDSGSVPGWLLVTIAAVGLLFGILFVAARRGRDRDEQQAAPVEAHPAPLVSPGARAGRRTVQLDRTEDPILAAMGIGESERPGPVAAPISRTVRSGPGERLK